MHAYSGIDASANPSLAADESLVKAYEFLLGEGRFGAVGTLVSTYCSEAGCRVGWHGIAIARYR